MGAAGLVPRCAVLLISLHCTRISWIRRSGKGIEGDGGCKGLSERLAQQAGEERLPLKSEIITANLGLKPEGNAPRGK